MLSHPWSRLHSIRRIKYLWSSGAIFYWWSPNKFDYTCQIHKSLFNLKGRATGFQQGFYHVAVFDWSSWTLVSLQLIEDAAMHSCHFIHTTVSEHIVHHVMHNCSSQAKRILGVPDCIFIFQFSFPRVYHLYETGISSAKTKKKWRLPDVLSIHCSTEPLERNSLLWQNV